MQASEFLIEVLSDFNNQNSNKQLKYSSIERQPFIIELQISSKYLTDRADYSLTFRTPSLIESGNKCFVKFSFPQEFDISSVDLSNITGQGMLADIDGEEKTFSEDEII